ncbi:unnamed protein product, partial [marine sediment metagenome]
MNLEFSVWLDMCDRDTEDEIVNPKDNIYQFGCDGGFPPYP